MFIKIKGQNRIITEERLLYNAQYRFLEKGIFIKI